MTQVASHYKQPSMMGFVSLHIINYQCLSTSSTKPLFILNSWSISSCIIQILTQIQHIDTHMHSPLAHTRTYTSVTVTPGLGADSGACWHPGRIYQELLASGTFCNSNSIPTTDSCEYWLLHLWTADQWSQILALLLQILKCLFSSRIWCVLVTFF